MRRVRRIGLALMFSATLAAGVLTAQPAQALTLSPAQCTRLASAITALTEVAAKHPNSALVAFLLREAEEAFQRFCS